MAIGNFTTLRISPSMGIEPRPTQSIVTILTINQVGKTIYTTERDVQRVTFPI